MKALAKRALRGVGLDVRYVKHTEAGILTDFLRILDPVVILDVGANTGQYAQLLRGIGYAGRIVSFEALQSAHSELVRHAAGDPEWIIAPCMAIGGAAATKLINVAGNSVSSSLLPMKEMHVRSAPESKYTGVQSVSVERLDTLASPFLPPSGALFLKIDTQGYEAEVLSGISGIIDRIAGIQVEMSLTGLYEGAPTFIELVGQLERLGYSLFQIIPGFRSDRTGRLLQVDGIFVRESDADRWMD